MNHLIPPATLALAALLNIPHARAEEATYRGFCDASAAVALDTKHFVVANDDRHALTIYAPEGRHAPRGSLRDRPGE